MRNSDLSRSYARPLHWLYATLGGFFWINCERCGKGFGGHQWGGKNRDAMTVQFEGGHGRCTYCPACAATRDRWEPGWPQQVLCAVSDAYICHVHMTAESSWCPKCVEEFKSRRPADTLTPAEKVAELDRWGHQVTIPFRDIHQRVEELLGRSVWTHEFAMPDQLKAEILGEMAPASMEDVMSKLGQIRPDMPVIVITDDKGEVSAE